MVKAPYLACPDGVLAHQAFDAFVIAAIALRTQLRVNARTAYQIKGVRGPRFKREDVEALITPIPAEPTKGKGSTRKKS